MVEDYRISFPNSEFESLIFPL